jgi:hypothetical protein
MELLKSILADQVYSQKNDSKISKTNQIKQKNQEEDGLESSGNEENYQKGSRIQNLELIGDNGFGIVQENFSFDDWKNLRSFYDRIQGEVNCRGAPLEIKSLTEKST